MRVAVLYSGQLRSWDRVKQNQFDNLGIDNDIIDLFFFSSEKPQDTDYKQFVKDHTGGYYSYPMNEYDSNKNPITQLHGSLCQWHVNFVGFSMLPTDYDCYVRSRADIELSGQIDFSQYEMKDNMVYVPSGNDHCGGVNDQFAFGNYQSMKKYFSVYLNHKDLFAKGLQFHTEFYTTENLKAQGVAIVRIPVTNVIIREDAPTVYSEDSRRIINETPEQHWRMLQVKDRVMIDMGCGRQWEGHPNTIEYFLNQGASKVYGVEMSHSEKPWYEKNVKDSRLRVFTDKIETKEQFHYYLMLLAPDVIKMDIEGHESLLESVDVADMAPVQEIAVEYHSKALRHLIEHNRERLQFNNIEFYKLQNFDPEEQGVIHLWK